MHEFFCAIVFTFNVILVLFKKRPSPKDKQIVAAFDTPMMMDY